MEMENCGEKHQEIQVTWSNHSRWTVKMEGRQRNYGAATLEGTCLCERCIWISSTRGTTASPDHGKILLISKMNRTLEIRRWQCVKLMERSVIIVIQTWKRKEERVGEMAGYSQIKWTQGSLRKRVWEDCKHQREWMYFPDPRPLHT